MAREEFEGDGSRDCEGVRERKDDYKCNLLVGHHPHQYTAAEAN